MGTPRYFGYIRVSTEEQAESRNGLDDQKLQIINAIRAKDLQLIWIAEDAGFSGSKLENRPALQSVLKRLKAREADGLVVAKVDRLSRSIVDFANTADMARKQHWNLICLDADIDTSKASGRFMVKQLALFAEFERELISERTKDGLRAAKARGIRLGGSKPIASQETIALIASLHARGLSYRQIARHLNDSGNLAPMGGQWLHSSVQKSLVRHAGSILDRQIVSPPIYSRATDTSVPPETFRAS